VTGRDNQPLDFGLISWGPGSGKIDWWNLVSLKFKRWGESSLTDGRD